MKTFFLALAYLALGCGSTLTAREACLGQCDDDGKGPGCHSSCPIERVIGVEYAGDSDPSPVTVDAPQEWGCAGIKAYRAKRAHGLGQPLVLRRAFTVRVSVRDMSDLGPEHAGTFMVSYSDISGALAPLPRILSERTALWHGEPGDADLDMLLSDIMLRYLHALSPPHEPYRMIGIGDQTTKCWRRGSSKPDLSTWPKEGPYVPMCRQWDGNGFVTVQSKHDMLWKCALTLRYRPLVATSDGNELGTPVSISRTERDLCGPATNARSGTEAALRKQAGPNVHIVEYGGDCVVVKP